MQLVEAMSRIGVESAFEVLVKARALEKQGKSVIHLEIGEPDFPTPNHVVEAGKRALDEGWTKYGPTQGLPELRESIAAYISRTRNIKAGPQHVCVVPGGKPVMYFAMVALLEAGDEAIYPNPGFPIYESMIKFQGAKPVPIPLEESRGFSFDLDLLERSLTNKTKLVILNSPANPTGGIMPAEDVKRLADIRDLLAHCLLRRAGFDRQFPRNAGENHHPRRILQNLFNDGMAAGLRRDAGMVGRRNRQADGQFELLHR
jgi:aspartate aminotransferase